jgi:hypothetical protein
MSRARMPERALRVSRESTSFAALLTFSVQVSASPLAALTGTIYDRLPSIEYCHFWNYGLTQRRYGRTQSRDNFYRDLEEKRAQKTGGV